MAMTALVTHKTRTLWLAGVLHAFTHIYNAALVPLYLLIQQDLKLASVGAATLLMTVMMVAYVGPSYLLGILADRLSRKSLMAWGLAINALGFIALGRAPNYAVALACVVVAGIGGSFYHPAATAMVARLCPDNKGKLLGLVGIGAGVGFFVGPIYSGWRAHALESTLGAAAWRQPALELGVLGLLMAGLFAWLAQEAPAADPQPAGRPGPARGAHDTLFPSAVLWLFFLATCLAFSLRDFAGSSMSSLGSLFLQRAHGFNLRDTGVALSGISLASIISNPLFGHLSDRGRKRWTCLVLSVAALLVALFPHVPRPWLVPTFVVYGFFFMASFPMLEAALMDAVPDAVRGRVIGLFITVCGLVGNLAHWRVGKWVQRLGDAADAPSGYYAMYAGLALLVVLALLGLPCLHVIRKREQKAEMVAPRIS